MLAIETDQDRKLVLRVVTVADITLNVDSEA